MEALKELKEGKAPGMDGCAVECLRRGGGGNHRVAGANTELVRMF